MRKYLGALAVFAALCVSSWAQAPAQAPTPAPPPTQAPAQPPAAEPTQTHAPARPVVAPIQYPRFELFAGGSYAEAGLFNDYFSAMPGVDFSPHAVRYAFATYGERDLGFKPGEGAIILDHMEGVEPTDVTGQFYSSDPQIGRKREMMRAWTDWCDGWAAN